VLAGWEISALEAADYPEETGGTHEENARLKARFGRGRAPRDAWVLGEDSGIEVAALGGGPGVNSARWADDWIGRLIGELDGVEDRRARYVCELVAVGPGGEEVRGTGTLEGRIATAPRGSGGFGYDPVFVPDGEERTVAELGDGWKRRHSHRARAARALSAALGAS
jgi:XTP/dITP diphosphohydrolase